MVSGWFLPELAALGIEVPGHDDRYAYTRRWLQQIVELWQGKEVALGAPDGPPALVRRVPERVPTVYVGGESAPGRALAADHADVYFLNGRPLEQPSTWSTTCVPAAATGPVCGSASRRS